MNIYLLYCLVAACLWAVANILAKVLLRWLNTKEIFSINFFIMAAILLLISPIFYYFIPSFLSIGLVLLVAIIDTGANYYYFEALKHNDTSQITPVLSLSPIFTFLLSWFFIFEKINVITYVLCIIMLILIVLFSTNIQSVKKIKFSNIKWAILSSILFGISAIPAKYLLTTLWAINAPTLYLFRAALIWFFAFFVFNFTLPRLSLKQYKFIGARGVIVIIQWVLFYYSITKIPVGVGNTLFSTTPIFVFILSLLFLHEKFTVKKIITSILIVLASFMIYFFI